MNITNNMTTKVERLKRYNNYIKIINERNPTETILEKQKRVSQIGRILFNIYYSSKSQEY